MKQLYINNLHITSIMLILWTSSISTINVGLNDKTNKYINLLLFIGIMIILFSVISFFWYMIFNISLQKALKLYHWITMLFGIITAIGAFIIIYAIVLKYLLILSINIVENICSSINAEIKSLQESIIINIIQSKLNNDSKLKTYIDNINNTVEKINNNTIVDISIKPPINNTTSTTQPSTTNVIPPNISEVNITLSNNTTVSTTIQSSYYTLAQTLLSFSADQLNGLLKIYPKYFTIVFNISEIQQLLTNNPNESIGSIVNNMNIDYLTSLLKKYNISLSSLNI